MLPAAVEEVLAATSIRWIGGHYVIEGPVVPKAKWQETPFLSQMKKEFLGQALNAYPFDSWPQDLLPPIPEQAKPNLYVQASHVKKAMHYHQAMQHANKFKKW